MAPSATGMEGVEVQAQAFESLCTSLLRQCHETRILEFRSFSPREVAAGSGVSQCFGGEDDRAELKAVSTCET